MTPLPKSASRYGKSPSATARGYTRRRATAGFTLIEIMVGLLMGMISTLIVMQVFSIFEGQKRAATSGGDALTNGAIALYQMQRDVRQAGYGLGTANLLGCDVLLRAGVTLNPLAPVVINPPTAFIPAGDANTDTVLMVYGNGNGLPEGDTLTASVPAMPSSFTANDRVIAQTGTTCGLTLDTVAAIAPTFTLSAGVPAAAADRLYNLGQAPKVIGYAVRGGNLTACDYLTPTDCSNAANWTPIANNIVSLRAQYGRDTATAAPTSATALPAPVVDTWDQSTPITANRCLWARISAVRFALVARNSQPSDLRAGQREVVTSAAPTWAGSAGALIDLTATTVPTGVTWQNYRYKVFQTVAPIRNMAWMGVQLGC